LKCPAVRELTELACRLLSPWLLPAVALACLIVWVLVLRRLRRGVPVVPYQPRRPVPWRGLDVLIVFLVYVVGTWSAMLLSVAWFEPKGIQPAAAEPATALHTENPAARVLMESKNVWVLTLCALTLIVVAPAVEEFLFRLLFQGWLEAVENRLLRRVAQFRKIPRGAVSVAISSLLFALVHCRPPLPPMELRRIILGLAVQAVMSLLTLALALVLLRRPARGYPAGATLEDLGIVPAKAAADVKLGLLACLAVTPPVLLLNVLVSMWLPKDVVADPIPIFFLALVLGTLYYRTHRIAASLVLHMAFNATGVAIALTMAGT
jgi:membrane protease YdiL (CAAX protease family)